AARRALDLLGATQPLLWRRGAELPESRPDAVICLDLPSREDFSALSRLSQPLLFLSAAQVPYARTLASPLTPFPLPSEADLARDRAEELRARVAQAIEGGPLDGELALLGPLFERYDPAEVAAGVLAVSRQPAAGGPQPLAAPHLPVARQRVFVGVGKKDRASAKDLLGALLREAGLSKEEVGRIEVRETFSLVEVAAPAIERAIRGLSGATIRGRRVVARLDRGR
ncbi:MAG TPA: DbpA RNA binding domain-containing protein, partial [Gemmatimonadales bacterium]|nr:DbpA RNA binding domain-containing protein [Gemmatimonadales bacterium]